MAWTTAPTFVAGTTLGASDLNKLSNDLNIIGAAWTAYTPTLTNITVGNGTRAFAFLQMGQTVFLRGQFSAGSTTTYAAGAFSMTLPVTPHSAYTTNGGYALGSAVLQATTSSSRVGSTLVCTTSGTLNFMVDNGTGNALATSTVPFTWNTSGTFSITATYEAA